MAKIINKPLTVDNLFDFCVLLDAVGAETMLEVFDEASIQALTKDGRKKKDVGVAIAMKVSKLLIQNLPKARKEIYGFLAGCMAWDNGSAVTAEELGAMRIGAFVNLLKEFFQQEDLTDFFRQAAGSADTEQSNLRSC